MSLESDQRDQRKADVLFIARIRGRIYLEEPCPFQWKNADGEACCSIEGVLNGLKNSGLPSCKFLDTAQIPLVTDPINLEFKDRLIEIFQEQEEKTEFDKAINARAGKIINELPTGIDSITVRLYARCHYIPRGIHLQGTR